MGQSLSEEKDCIDKINGCQNYQDYVEVAKHEYFLSSIYDLWDCKDTKEIVFNFIENLSKFQDQEAAWFAEYLMAFLYVRDAFAVVMVGPSTNLNFDVLLKDAKKWKIRMWNVGFLRLKTLHLSTS